MAVTTTHGIDSRRIADYPGIVSADVVMGGNILRDFFASVRDIVGGRSSSYETVFTDAKEAAIRDLVGKARSLGADAVVGVDIDCEVIGGDQRTLLMVSANGTAVKLG